MRCCGSGLPGQFQPSGHEYGAKVLKEEKGAKGLEGEKGASPVWGWFCSGGGFPTPFWCCFWYRVGGWFGEGGHHAVLAPLGCVAGGCGCSTSCW